jgi:hypothetical protein
MSLCLSDDCVGRCIGLYVGLVPSSLLPLPIFDPPELTRFLCFFPFLRVTQKGGTDRGIDPEYTETVRIDAFPVGGWSQIIRSISLKVTDRNPDGSIEETWRTFTVGLSLYSIMNVLQAFSTTLGPLQKVLAWYANLPEIH